MSLQVDSSILDLSPVIVLNINSTIEKWNQGLSQIYGWTQPEALGKNAHHLLMTVFPQPLDEIKHQIFENGEWQGELIHFKKNGSLIIVNSHWILQRNDEGENLAILEFINDITRYKSIKDTLSESIYKHVVDDSPLATFLATLEGKPILFNLDFPRMFGYQSPEECIDLIQNVADIFLDPEHQAEFVHMLQDPSTQTTFENLYRRKDGSTFWGKLLVHQAENRVGAEPYYVGFIEDITKSKQVEEALQISKKWVESVLESVADTYIVFDREWRYRYVNKAAIQRIGWPKEQILDHTLWELYPDIIGTELERQFRRAMDSRIPVIFDFYFPGTDTWWQNRYYPTPEGLAVFATNITEQKRIEEKLHQAERFTQATIDGLSAHICVLDEYGVILSTNRSWREFADANGAMDPQHYLGANYLAVCDSAMGKDSEGASVFAEGIRKVMRHEIELFSLEYTCDSPRENRWFIGTVTRFNGGEIARLVISHINITERKMAEKGLRESRERLSHLSHRLVETQEQERRRIARELHDDIGQTLTALMITLNGIHQAALDPALIDKFTNLQNLVHELIDKVISLSSDLRPRVLDDLGLIPGLISMINRLTTQTGIQIDFKYGRLEYGQIPPEIEITAYRIIQEALTNLIRHAEAKLAIVRIQIDENTLWIQVQDEGKGFEYSSAVNSAHSMGLMNMLERAELVGGLVTIQTAPGEGTNITCRLPLGEGLVERRKNARN